MISPEVDLEGAIDPNLVREVQEENEELKLALSRETLTVEE